MIYLFFDEIDANYVYGDGYYMSVAGDGDDDGADDGADDDGDGCYANYVNYAIA